jgi:hypothetical protein
LCWLHWKNFSWQHWMFFFRLFTLCSARCQCISNCVESVWKNRKMEDLSDFETGQIVGARLVGASVTKTATLLGVSRATVPKVMSAYTNHGKTPSAKRKSGRKSTVTKRDRRTLRRFVSKSHTTTAAQVDCSRTEYSCCRPCFHKTCPTSASQIPHRSTAGLQLLNLWLLKVTLRCVNDGVTTVKPGHQTTGNACPIWWVESYFTPFPTSGRVYVWRTPKEAYNPECLVPTLKHGGGSVMVWALFKTCTSPFQGGLRLYCRQKVAKHHINKEMCTVSVVFPLFCPTPVSIVCYLTVSIPNRGAYSVEWWTI